MFRKKIIRITIAALFLLISNAVWSYQTYSRYGAGVSLFDPFGVTGKYWLDSKQGIDLAIGSSGKKFQIHGDYLFHDFSLIKVKEVKLPLYFGGGPRFRFGNEFGFALRPVAGIGAIFADNKLEGYLEVAPLILSLAPDVSVDWSAALGIRYYFRP